MKYVYPAIFYKDKTLPDTYSVIFPDVSGAATCGYSLYEALRMAEDALCGILIGWEDSKTNGEKFGNRITEPTPIEDIIAEPDEFSSKAFVTLIAADTDAYRKQLKLLPPRKEDDSDDDFEIPETLAREICRVAGINYPFEAEK